MAEGDPLENRVEELEEQRIKDEYEKVLNEKTKLVSSIFDKSSAYINMVVMIGYVGFFTVWNNLKSQMTDFEMANAGFGITISGLVYVIWVVYTMIFMAEVSKGKGEVLRSSPDEFFSEWKKVEKLQDEKRLAINRFWPLALAATILPGLWAVGILIKSFLRILY